MAEKYCDTEILEHAISREVDAYYFYMAIAEHVEDPEMSKVLREFAAEEIDHKKKLELELLKVGHTIPVDPELPKPTRDNYIISNTDKPLDMEYIDILLLAIEKEKASFRTYIELLATVHDPQSREVLLEIAEEEVKHKMRFEIEYGLLTKNHEQ
ncbi:ferritin family protein [Planctomycetota bacterium]